MRETWFWCFPQGRGGVGGTLSYFDLKGTWARPRVEGGSDGHTLETQGVDGLAPASRGQAGTHQAPAFSRETLIPLEKHVLGKEARAPSLLNFNIAFSCWQAWQGPRCQKHDSNLLKVPWDRQGGRSGFLP